MPSVWTDQTEQNWQTRAEGHHAKKKKTKGDNLQAEQNLKSVGRTSQSSCDCNLQDADWS